MLDSVTPTAQVYRWNPITQHIPRSLSVPLNGEVQVAQLVFGEGVGPALYHQHIRAIRLHAPIHDLFEEVGVYVVGYAALQGNIDCEVLADPLARGVKSPCAWEEVLFELVEADRHDPVGVIEGFFHPIPVVHIDVQVQHPGVYLQQLQDAHYDIVDVAEATGLCFARMVVASRPVQHDIRHARYDHVSGVQTGPCGELAEIVEPIEAGAVECLVDLVLGLELGVIAGFPSLLLLVEVGGVVLLGRDPLLQVIDVAWVMEVGHLFGSGLLALEHVEVGGHAVALDEAVGHADAFGLHGVLAAEVVVGDGLVVDVGDLLHLILYYIKSQSHNIMILPLIFLCLVSLAVAPQCTNDPITGICSCPLHEYPDVNGNCRNCDPNCYSCVTSSRTCTECYTVNNFALSGTVCVCKDGYYTSGSNCNICHYTCATCTGPNSNNCVTCDTTIRYDSGGGTCSCLPGTYDDTTNQVCAPCDDTCLTCTSGTNVDCTSCDSNDLRHADSGTSPFACICDDGYYDNGSALCSPCIPSCLTCNILNSTCVTCDATLFRTLVGTSCLCITHYYDAGAALCGVCSPRCNNCTGSPQVCTSCASNRVLTGTACPCIDSYYQDSATITCLPCTSYCKTCQNSSSTCLSCITYGYRYLYNATCPCLPGYYDNGTAMCILCPYSCQQCTGPSPPVCTVCPASTYRELSSGACPCIDGYYDDGGNPTCLPCYYACQTCSSQFTCLTCDSADYRTIVATDCACMTGYYDDGVNRVCQPCHYSCIECFGPSSTDCYTCQSNRDYNSYSCPCFDGFYELSQICSPCDSICETCSILSSNCTSCAPSRTLQAGTCVCAPGYYTSGASCPACSPECLNCTSSASTCTACVPAHLTILVGSSCSCPDGYYKNMSSYICVLCHYSCMTCSGGLSTDCLTCNATLLRASSSTSCLCAAAYYDNGVGLCAPCNANCLLCYGGTDYDCSSCAASYSLVGTYCRPPVACSSYLYEGQCINTCPYSTYPSAHLCVQCSTGCYTCLSSTQCTSCLEGYYYDPALYSCSLRCPTGKYTSSSNECIACSTNCLSCVLRSSIVACTQCLTGSYLLDETTCVSACPTGYVVYGNQCLRCVPNCATCSALSASACLTCLSGSYLLGTTCYSTCPLGYQPASGLCSPCPTNCSTCMLNECLSCNDAFYLSIDGECLPVGYFKSGSALQECHPNCHSCTNSSFSSCIACSSLRGDNAELAVSGYCECKPGSIDMGDGRCDRQAYTTVLKMTDTIVGASEATLYFSLLTSVVTRNFLPSFIALVYFQTYSNFYFLNASSVMQADVVLEHYLNINPNSYYRQQVPASHSSRLLLSTQYDGSLFLRGAQHTYLCVWGLPTVVVTLCLWAVLFAMSLCLCVITRRNKVMNAEITQRSSRMDRFKDSLTRMKDRYHESAVLVAYLLTHNEVFFYGIASFKILALTYPRHINFVYLVLSLIIMLYYLVYLVRLLVGCYLANTPALRAYPSPLWLIFHRYRHASTSSLHSLFIPLLMLRNLCIVTILVLLSEYPILQAAISLFVFLCSFLMNFYACPWPRLIRIWFHLLEFVMVFQISALLYLTSIPEASRVRPAIFLVAINFIQVFILALCAISVIIDKVSNRDANSKQNNKKFENKEFDENGEGEGEGNNINESMENLKESDVIPEIKRYRVIRKYDLPSLQ